MSEYQPPADAAGLLHRLHPVRLWLYPTFVAVAVLLAASLAAFAGIVAACAGVVIVESLCERVHSPRDLARAERAAYRAGVARGRAFLHRHPTMPFEESHR